MCESGQHRPKKSNKKKDAKETGHRRLIYALHAVRCWTDTTGPRAPHSACDHARLALETESSKGCFSLHLNCPILRALAWRICLFGERAAGRRKAHRPWHPLAPNSACPALSYILVDACSLLRHCPHLWHDGACRACLREFGHRSDSKCRMQTRVDRRTWRAGSPLWSPLWSPLMGPRIAPAPRSSDMRELSPLTSTVHQAFRQITTAAQAHLSASQAYFSSNLP